ncbi:hypothetical protein nbrc107696_27990 [Gordonia spumicola]|uniref:Uncharacterized protein n=1 Tax=Gordonia spumicola TaxID=589161 RepID=A0A7I9VB74_9ACTN|nr:hypothetical protein [Gordonia spumicola]GEE02353.1 hypothetical protein nbrc107696_27990 [Gordonia spumicola]
MTGPQRGIAPHRESDRGDLAAFVARAGRVDESGVVRLHQRPDDRVGLWVRTGFDVLATRSIFGTVEPSDVIGDLTVLASSLAAADAIVQVGNPPTIAWQGALPGANGYIHVDDVPARAIVDLARRGLGVARDESGALGPASSLLDQKVLSVTGGDDTVDVTMRAVFALTSMGFVRDAAGHEITADSSLDAIAADEPVRVRASAAWVRLDARFGSVYQRRTALSLNVGAP